MKTLELRCDIQKVIDAIDNEVDAYILSFTEKTKNRRNLAREIFKTRKKQTKSLAVYMYKKYAR